MGVELSKAWEDERGFLVLRRGDFLLSVGPDRTAIALLRPDCPDEKMVDIEGGPFETVRDAQLAAQRWASRRIVDQALGLIGEIDPELARAARPALHQVFEDLTEEGRKIQKMLAMMRADPLLKEFAELYLRLNHKDRETVGVMIDALLEKQQRKGEKP